MIKTAYYIHYDTPVRTYSAKAAQQASDNGHKVNAVTYHE